MSLAQFISYPLEIDLKTIITLAVALLVYFVRKEIIQKISDEREKTKEIIDREFKADEEKRIVSSAKKFFKIEELTNRIYEIEKRFELSINSLDSKIDKDISLLGQTTENTIIRLDKIEDHIKELNDKMDAQRTTLTEILNAIKREWSVK